MLDVGIIVSQMVHDGRLGIQLIDHASIRTAIEKRRRDSILFSDLLTFCRVSSSGRTRQGHLARFQGLEDGCSGS